MNTVLSTKKTGRQVTLTVAPRKYKFLMELLGNFNFVTINGHTEPEDDDDGETREEIIAKLKGAAHDLKLIKEGKLETRTLKEFLDELHS